MNPLESEDDNPFEGNFQMYQLHAICPECGEIFYFHSDSHYGYCNNCGLYTNVMKMIEDWLKEKEEC